MPRTAENGFTMVEILVVLLIVAVLAAIAIPLYSNQRVTAQDAEAKTSVAVAAAALAIYHQDHGTYADVDRAALERLEPALQHARGLTVEGTDAGYVLSIESAAGSSGGGPFAVEHTLTSTRRTCDGAGRGGCPDSGVW